MVKFLGKSIDHRGRDLHIVGVGGSRLDVLGSLDFTFKIGRLKLTQKCHVINNLGKNVILGVDFLTKHNAMLDFSKKTMNIAGQTVVLTSKDAPMTKIALVTVKYPMTIQPFTEIIMPIRLSRKFSDKDLVLTPLDNANLFRNEPGILMTSQVTENKAPKLVISNQTGKMFKIKRNQPLAFAEPMPKNVSISTIETIQEEANERSKGSHKLDHVPPGQRYRLLSLFALICCF